MKGRDSRSVDHHRQFYPHATAREWDGPTGNAIADRIRKQADKLPNDL